MSLVILLYVAMSLFLMRQTLLSVVYYLHTPTYTTYSQLATLLGALLVREQTLLVSLNAMLQLNAGTSSIIFPVCHRLILEPWLMTSARTPEVSHPLVSALPCLS